MKAPAAKMHERVDFGAYGCDGGMYVIVDDDHETRLYFGIAGLGRISPSVTAFALTIAEAEAAIALLQKGLDMVKANAARVVEPVDAGTDETEAV